MPSFDVVNYSLRPSKGIQRKIVFDGIHMLKTHLALEQLIYIGLGSIWFTDFVIAHKLLGVNDMVSIEADDVGFHRARFNSPYATVDVRHGSSSTVLPKLFSNGKIKQRPWVIWLDYDTEFDEGLVEDTRNVVENAPDNTTFLITFNGNDTKYGVPRDRPDRLRQLFEDVVPDDLSISGCKAGRMQNTLADLAIAFMKSVAAVSVRSGGFIPAFRLLYKDSASMVTVGGFLPSTQTHDHASELVKRSDWKCQPMDAIIAPHLTIREAMALQSKLPDERGLSRDSVRSLGFDLEDRQIEAYVKYYREYPTFAQIVT